MGSVATSEAATDVAESNTTADTSPAQPEEQKVIVLFDVDGTLTYPRQRIKPETEEWLQKLRQKVTVGIVGGSDLVKILEQLGGDDALNKYDYVFSENGLVAHKDGSLISRENIIHHIGEDRFQDFVNFSLEYMSKLRLPFKRGTFIETRSGLVNIAPCGRNASAEERDEFEKYDKVHEVRRKFIEALKERFADYNFVYSIGGQISFDVFPEGWDKRFCLTQVQKDKFNKIYFFGDKTFKGGNDYEIFEDARTEGYTVKNPEDTVEYLKKLFAL